MPPPKQPLSHRRTHHLLLLSRLINLRDTTASPFTLILDSTSQSSKPLVGEFIRRANLAKCSIVFVGFESLRAPFSEGQGGAKHVFIKARGKGIAELQKETYKAATGMGGKTLIIIDSLHALCSLYPTHISTFLSSLITPHSTLLATYHLDIPLTPSSQSQPSYPDTAPHPLTLLKYLCTTLITVHSITHILLQKRHKDKSLLPPRWGLLEEHPGGRGGGIEGVVVGMGANSRTGVVIEFEHRRKSGRGVQEWFFFPMGGTEKDSSSNTKAKEKDKTGAGAAAALFEKVGAPPGVLEKIILLEDHPEWRLSEQVAYGRGEEDTVEVMPQTTFDLGLTEKQKKARDEVVLPYFDAQDEMGLSGGGGRILYMPEREADDWDEEEDEL